MSIVGEQNVRASYLSGARNGRLMGGVGSIEEQGVTGKFPSS